QLRLKDVAQNAALISFEDLNVSKLDISAQLMWVRSKTGPEVFLAWQITLVPNSNSDYWQIRVDAHTNRVIDVTNLTVYCKWDDPAHAILPNHVHIANPEMDAVFSLQPAVEEGSPDIIQGASYRVIP